MPRLRTTDRQASYGSPNKTNSIPLNDDRAEKAQRLQSRKQLAHKQTDSIRAAASSSTSSLASPARKRRSLGISNDDPSSPGQEEDEYGLQGKNVTPMKRVPILANFEEWIKMATDNKINAANSWNFALIDYFHDMSLLREGDGVNFQKASCTLDGCVKIYTSRVDSVATETGKLLSGLADSGSKKRMGNNAEGEGEDADEEEEEGEIGKKRSKKRPQRNAEATLVAHFDQLRLKKMELEFSVDPLFKKAAADFDEGGAKGLLMNHLAIDSNGRIVFDSSDDVLEDDDADAESRRDSLIGDGESGEDLDKASETVQEDGPINIAALGARFFPSLSQLNQRDICPSLKSFELGSGDDGMNLPFLKAPENWRDEHADPALSGTQMYPANSDSGPAFDEADDDGGLGGFDLPPDTGFGEGGEAWARDAALEPQLRVYDMQRAHSGGDSQEVEGDEVGMFDTSSKGYGVKLQHQRNAATAEHDNILNYFDTALHKNWAGPEHWKIARIKDASISKSSAEKKVRKEKEPFEIDFTSHMSTELAAQLYTFAPSNSSISLPKNQWRSKTRNLLPDDKHFNSKDLLKLFLKPKAQLGSRIGERRLNPASNKQPQEIDEAYWALHENAAAQPQQRHPMDDDDSVGPIQGNYNADFFQDDALPMSNLPFGGDDDTFADAQEQFAPAFDDADAVAGADRPEGAGIDSIAASGVDGSQQHQTEGGAFGLNLVTQSRRLRPEYVQYARVAKKVDVRRLKENMWKGIGFGGTKDKVKSESESNPDLPALSAHDENATLKFTHIMNNLQHVYPQQQMRDISTSFGFICLLHLANEKGLVIENCEGWTDLSVKRDFEAVDLDQGR